MSKSSNISNYLVKTGQEIATATESLLEYTQDWQIILEFMKNRIEGIKLTKKQQEKMKRYQFAYGQASSGKFTDAEIVNLLMSEYTIGLTQAYEDMRCMREIYTVVGNINKRYEISIQLQINRRLMIKCEEMGEMLILAMFEKNRVALLKELKELEENPADDFKGHTFIPVFDPKLINEDVIDERELMRVINEKRAVKINLDKISTDLPYEESRDENPLQPPPAT